jgi:hypothetical protein
MVAVRPIASTVRPISISSAFSIESHSKSTPHFSPGFIADEQALSLQVHPGYSRVARAARRGKRK